MSILIKKSIKRVEKIIHREVDSDKKNKIQTYGRR